MLTLCGGTAALAVPIDLGHPNLTPGLASNIGSDSDRSVVFDVLVPFSISSAGIRFDPLTGGATELTVSIYQSGLNAEFSNGGADHGSLLGTASTAITDVGLAFYDVPIAFAFAAGSRYDLAFTVNGRTGWGYDINNLEFYNYNFAVPGGPYTAGGLVSVVDGASHPDTGNYNNTVMPHARFDGAAGPVVPEPASLLLFGTGLAGLRVWRKRR
jgi:hypothetical protein